ncbi:MAG: PAS domain S-box protein [Idiomarina sp.]|nr:PAS domain S-box protein [Idiomarina sp.]
MTTESGVIIAHPQRSELLQILDTNLQSELLTHFGTESDAQVVHSNFSGDALQTYQRIPSTGWIIGATLPLDEAMTPIQTLWRVQLIGGGIFTLIALLALIGIIHSQLRPIRRLQREVSLVRQNHALRLSEPRLAELLQLVRNFNQLIDENEHQRRALKQRQAYFDMVLNTSSVGHFVADSRGFIEYVNGALETITGYSEEQIRQGQLADGLEDSTGKQERDRWVNALEAHQEIEIEFKFRRADKTLVWLHIASKPVFDHGLC